MNGKEELFKKYLDDCAAKITAKMDEVMEKYVYGKLPAQMITDESEVASILAGMGLVEFTFTPATGVVMKTKKPLQVYWNGSKFQISLKEEVTNVNG